MPIDPHGDLWWAGDAQNGWGLAVLQQNATLFALWLTYDASGQATWFVMPAGTWDETNTVYSGLLYIPHGAPYFAFDSARFGSGAAVGNARRVDLHIIKLRAGHAAG